MGTQRIGWSGAPVLVALTLLSGCVSSPSGKATGQKPPPVVSDGKVRLAWKNSGISSEVRTTIKYFVPQLDKHGEIGCTSSSQVIRESDRFSRLTLTYRDLRVERDDLSLAEALKPELEKLQSGRLEMNPDGTILITYGSNSTRMSLPLLPTTPVQVGDRWQGVMFDEDNERRITGRISVISHEPGKTLVRFSLDFEGGERSDDIVFNVEKGEVDRSISRTTKDIAGVKIQMETTSQSL